MQFLIVLTVINKRLRDVLIVERFLLSTLVLLVDLWGQTKMGTVLITFKIMPESVDVALDALEETVKEKITAFGGKVAKIEKEPVAFGLTALKIIFSLDESKGATDPLEDDLKSLEEVLNVEVVDVRRAFG